VPGFEQFAVFTAPGDAISRRKTAGDGGDRALSFMDSALQVAPFDAVLHADIARVVLAIDEGSAAGLVDIRQFAERDLLTGGRPDQQIPDFPGILAKLRLHAYHQVPDGRLDDSLHIGDVDPVASDLVAVNIDEQTRLAEFAHDG